MGLADVATPQLEGVSAQAVGDGARRAGVDAVGAAAVAGEQLRGGDDVLGTEIENSPVNGVVRGGEPAPMDGIEDAVDSALLAAAVGSAVLAGAVSAARARRVELGVHVDGAVQRDVGDRAHAAAHAAAHSGQREDAAKARARMVVLTQHSLVESAANL